MGAVTALSCGDDAAQPAAATALRISAVLLDHPLMPTSPPFVRAFPEPQGRPCDRWRPVSSPPSHDDVEQRHLYPHVLRWAPARRIDERGCVMKVCFARFRLPLSIAVAALVGAACAAHAGAEVQPQAGPQAPLQPGQDVILYQQARERLAPVDAAYQQALAESLSSQNKYERRLALDRLTVLRVPLDPSLLDPLVELLPETDKLHDEQCAEIVDRLSRSYGGQGEELMYAHCNVQGGTSNGSLAARLLGRFGGTGRVQPAIVEHVRAHPDEVEAVIDSLGGHTGAMARATVEALGATGDRRVQQALLRLALSAGCDELSDPKRLGPVVALLDSKEVGLAAALALLRLSACEREQPELAGANDQATRIVTARLQDYGDQDIVAQVSRLGGAATRFAVELQKRFEANRAERPAIIKAYGAMRYRGEVAVPLLVSVLKDAESSYLHGVALEALAWIGPGSSMAKPAILALLRDQEFLYRTEALQALAGGGVKLSRRELEALVTTYAKHCADAGSIPFFNLGRDAQCAKQAEALSQLAERAKLPFRAVGWQR